MRNKGSITRETFAHLSQGDQLWILFDTLQTVKEECCLRGKRCETRFEKIENSKSSDKALVVLGGVIGGFLAWLVSWLRTLIK